MNEDDYQPLVSDEVFVAGVATSDIQAMWRAFARSEGVRKVAWGLASDPARIRDLCQFVEHLLEQPYERGFRHPHDIAICAALVILEQSRLSEVRNLFARLRVAREPSLTFIQRMAEYCDSRFVSAQLTEYAGTARIPGPMNITARATENRLWSDPSLVDIGYSLQVASS